MYTIAIPEKEITYPGIKPHKYGIDKFGNVINDKGKVLKHRITKKGYHALNLSRDGKSGSQHVFVHRLVAHEFIPNPKNKPFVNHITGNKSDNYYEHLEWSTHGENMKHAFSSGLFDNKMRTKRGENGCNVKYSDEFVEEIRHLVCDEGYTKAEVSRMMSERHPELNLNPKKFQYYIYNLLSPNGASDRIRDKLK